MKQIVYGFMLLLAAIPAARANDDASGILEAVESKMASIESLSAEISVAISDTRPGYNAKVDLSAKVRLMKPNLLRIDFEEETRKVEQGDPVRKKFTVASDGKTEWSLDQSKSEYREKAVDPDGANLEIPSHFPLRMFFNAKVPHTDAPAKYLGIEKWNGEPCRVVEFREMDADAAKPPLVRQRLYIGQDNLIRRYVNEQMGGRYVEETVFRNIRIDEPLTPSDFSFSPPEGFKKRTPAPSPLLVAGTLAPDFTIADRTGKPIKLSDFRGKTVVLDFWASWCGPCAEALPQDNALAKKLEKTAIFLAINVQDAQESFDRWISFHTELDALLFGFDESVRGKDVASALYKAPGLPVLYVIGKDGKVAKSFLGFGYSSLELEAAIKAAAGETRKDAGD